jgi:methionyl-tRNA formyltransferase
MDATDTETIEVPWINNRVVRQRLQTIHPDLVIVIGVSILKTSVLTATGAPIINIHGGILPFYRGNHCIFYAYYDGRLDRVGSTIHFIDKGVDTGDIIGTFPPPNLLDCHGPEQAYCKAEKAAFEGLVDIIKSYQSSGTITGVPQSRIGRTIRNRDRNLLHEIRYFLRKLRRRFRRLLLLTKKRESITHP